MCLFAKHEATCPGRGIESTLGQSNDLLFSVTIGEHGDKEEAERLIGRPVESLCLGAREHCGVGHANCRIGRR